MAGLEEYLKNDEMHLQNLAQIARMYYNEGYTQDEIARCFGISRSSVSMFLSEAKNRNVVQITIKNPSANNQEVAAQMERTFSLTKCVAIPTSTHGSSSKLLSIVAAQAAVFFSKIMRSHSSIGVLWGTTCYEFMQAFPQNTGLCDVSVVPLIGGSSFSLREFQLNEMVRMFAEKLCGTPLFIYSPFMVSTMEDKQRLTESFYMQAIIEKWANLDFAVVGIGSPPSLAAAALPHDPFASVSDVSTFPYQCAVGNIAARLYDIHGKFLDCDYNAKLIGIDERCLRNTGKVIAVATGVHKTSAIIGALRTGLINYFVTDEITARRVLNSLENLNMSM